MSLKTKFSVVYFSLIVGVVYTLIGLLVTFNVLHDSCEIPRLSWLDPLEHCNVSTVTVKRDAVLMLRNNTEELVTSSAFVIAAKEHSIPLAKVFNRLLVFTALTCAQTSLYVAARALSGLATQLRRSEAKFWIFSPFLERQMIKVYRFAPWCYLLSHSSGSLSSSYRVTIRAPDQLPVPRRG